MANSKIIFFGETLIDLTQDTVAADKLLRGHTAHGKDGEAITGTCDFDADTGDATAGADDILLDETAYVNGVKVVGSMPNNGAVAGERDDRDGEYTVPMGYHDGSGKVGIKATERAKIIGGNIKAGVTILGQLGTYGGEAVTAQKNNVTPAKDEQTVLPHEGHD